MRLERPLLPDYARGQKLVDEMSLAARIEAALIEDIPSIQVEAKEAEVFIYLKRDLYKDKELISRITRLAANLTGPDIKINCLMRSWLPAKRGGGLQPVLAEGGRQVTFLSRNRSSDSGDILNLLRR